jgi:pimeloyl-ACP methyl ester carboxylesterase
MSNMGIDSNVRHLNVAGTDVALSLTERGEGRPVLLLHGGAGPQSVGAFAELLASSASVRVFTPTHPGFAATPRPDSLESARGLAVLYCELLIELGLHDVIVVGNSLGGWIAAEMALVDPTRLAGLVLVDAVGIEVPDHPVVDFFSLTLDQVAQLSYHDPVAFRIDPDALPAPVRAAMPGNREALKVYGGATMVDPGLAGRLEEVATPTLVLWGESDQIADADYGRAFAAAIPGARFQLLMETGHVPQIETPGLLAEAITAFSGSLATA